MDSLQQLQNDIVHRRLSRRGVLKRAMALGFNAPIIAGLLASCGGDDDDDDGGEATSSAASPTSPPAAQPTATTASAATEPAESPTTEVSPTAAESAASPTEAVTEPAGGQGLVRLLWWQAPTILNNHLAQGGKDYDASHICLEPLADYDNDANLVPFLAAEIPSLENGGVAEDGLSVTWQLREGVTWHDGEPFTSADVKFTYEFATNPEAATTTVANYATIDTIETPDDYTVVITFKQPTPNWFTPFTGIYGYIVPEHILKDYMGAEAVNAPFNLAPIGTGPFTVKEFRPGDVVLYERYEGYWDPGKPHFDEVELKGGGDAPSAARAALVSGEVDWAWNLQVEAAVLQEMASSGGSGELLSVPSASCERLMINFSDPDVEVDGERSSITKPHPFLSELAARQALTYVPDRDTIAGQLYGVAGEPTSNVITAPPRFVSPNTSYEFNLDTAAQMLDAAGWTLDGGQRAKGDYKVDFLYQTSTNAVRQKTQEIVKQALESIGIPTEIKAIDAAVYFSSDAGNPDTYAHFYADLEMFTNSGDPYPLNYMGFYSSVDPENIAQQSNGWSGRNVYRWVNDEFNQLFTQAQTEIDPDTQVELFVGMNDLIVTDVCEIPLVHRANVSAHASDLVDFIPSGWASDTWSIKHWRRS